MRGKHAKKKRMPLLGKVVCAILGVFLMGAFAMSAYSLSVANRLDDALSAGGDNVSLPASNLKDPFYVLLLGSDSREGTSIEKDKSADGFYSQRADVMMLVRVDTSNRQITMVSIPRDTRCYAIDGTASKINDSYGAGPIGSIEAVSDLTGVPISYYAAVDFASFEAIIDALGGIKVNVPADIQYKDALTGEMLYLKAGEQVLDGQHAQLFARARKEYGEDVRQSNNRQMIEAMIKAVFDRPVWEIPGTVLDAAGYVSTNVRSGDLIKMASAFALGSGDLTFYSCTGPKDGDFDSAYGGTWYCYDNPEGWAEIMEAVEAGEDPSKIDVDDTAIIHS